MSRRDPVRLVGATRECAPSRGVPWSEERVNPVNQHPEHPVSITSARPSRSEDMHKRQMRYLLSMGIRTVCFVLAIVTTGPLRWVLVAAAVFLPYVAVVLANATDRRTLHRPGGVRHEERPALTAGEAASPDQDKHDA